MNFIKEHFIGELFFVVASSDLNHCICSVAYKHEIIKASEYPLKLAYLGICLAMTHFVTI